MAILFISDLHLDAHRPDIGDQFLEFMHTDAANADALYILGDLFETWIGDDDPNEHYAVVKAAIRSLVDSGVQVYFMHGNRDFMIGEQFAAETGVELLPDPHKVVLFGQTVLLSHGDAMCTDDIEYQKFRALSRNPDWQKMMLQKSLAERQAFAAEAREASAVHGATISEAISDVNKQAVEQTMRDHGVTILLHGHTHRPAVHRISVDGHAATRIVLGDWYDQGSVVAWNRTGPELRSLPR